MKLDDQAVDAIPGIDLALTSEFDSPRLHQFNPFRATQPGVSADCPTLLLDRCLRVNYLRLRQRNRLLQTDSDDTLPSLAQTRKEGCCERGSILRLANRKVGPSKTHIALGLGLAACQRGLTVRFTTASALVHELMEARDERSLLRLQKQLSRHKLLIVDELGFVPLSKTGAELLFEVFSQRYEQGSIIVTSNLPFDEWTEVFGSERLTGALLDRLTHHVQILEMNGESYRLKQTRERRLPSSSSPDEAGTRS